MVLSRPLQPNNPSSIEQIKIFFIAASINSPNGKVPVAQQPATGNPLKKPFHPGLPGWLKPLVFPIPIGRHRIIKNLCIRRYFSLLNGWFYLRKSNHFHLVILQLGYVSTIEQGEPQFIFKCPDKGNAGINAASAGFCLTFIDH